MMGAAEQMQGCKEICPGHGHLMAMTLFASPSCTGIMLHPACCSPWYAWLCFRLCDGCVMVAGRQLGLTCTCMAIATDSTLQQHSDGYLDLCFCIVSAQFCLGLCLLLMCRRFT